MDEATYKRNALNDARSNSLALAQNAAAVTASYAAFFGNFDPQSRDDLNALGAVRNAANSAMLFAYGACRKYLELIDAELIAREAITKDHP